jgi:hypothetical protein
MQRLGGPGAETFEIYRTHRARVTSGDLKAHCSRPRESRLEYGERICCLHAYDPSWNSEAPGGNRIEHALQKARRLSHLVSTGNALPASPRKGLGGWWGW